MSRHTIMLVNIFCILPYNYGIFAHFAGALSVSGKGIYFYSGGE